jgi:hypothetical protein
LGVGKSCIDRRGGIGQADEVAGRVVKTAFEGDAAGGEGNAVGEVEGELVVIVQAVDGEGARAACI